jgi:uncharacterized SAM-binding protein YcdF (DUF218 family)
VRRPGRRFWLVLLGLAVVLLAFHAPILRGLGTYLIDADEPAPADVAVVLAGDMTGERLRSAISLVHAGFVPLIAVSGPCCLYGQNEGDMAVEMAVKEGHPRNLFVVVPNRSHSTREESVEIARFLRKRRFSSYLLVTSNFHTRRARSVYRTTTPEMSIRVIAAPYEDFKPDLWWRSRQGQKVFLGEWERVVANWLGI